MKFSVKKAAVSLLTIACMAASVGMARPTAAESDTPETSTPKATESAEPDVAEKPTEETAATTSAPDDNSSDSQSATSVIKSALRKIGIMRAPAASTYAVLKNGPSFRFIDSFFTNAVSFQEGMQTDYEANQSSAKEIQDASSPEKIYMWHDTDDHYYWYSPADTVYFSENSNGMFSDCSSLTSLDVSHFNTANVTDMSAMFSGCSSLTSLDLRNFNTSSVTDMEAMFENCSSLTSLDLGNFNTSNVTDMDNMFGECSSLTSLDVGNFDTSNVTSMYYTFIHCSSLASIDVSRWNTANVTNMMAMFTGCSKLTSIDVSKWNVSKVTNVTHMFQRCSSLTSLDVSRWDTSSVTDMTSMFIDCSSLASIDVSGWNVSNVAGMSGMFEDCSKLTTIDMGKWNMSKVTDRYAFDSFSGLQSLTVIVFPSTCQVKPQCDGDGSLSGFYKIDDDGTVTDTAYDLTTLNRYTYPSLGGYWAKNPRTVISSTLKDSDNFKANAVSFSHGTQADYNTNKASAKEIQDSSSAEKIYMWHNSNNDYYWYSQANTVYLPADSRYMFDGCSSLKSLDIKDFNTSKVTDMSWMFNGCFSLTSLDVGKLNTASVTNMAYTFHNCSKLTALDVTKFNTTKVTDMNHIFSGCSSLMFLDVSSFDTINVTDMSYMFSGCSSLTSLNLGSFYTADVTNMSNMFDGCSSLTSLNLRGFNTADVTNMYGMFTGCSKLAALDVSNFNTTKVTDMSFMFSNCSSLTSLDVRNFDTTNVTSMYSMFDGCSSLKSLVENFDTSNVTSMLTMFDECSSLTSLDVSQWNTTNVTNIMMMFEKCRSLTSLDMGSWDMSKVTRAMNAFYGLSSLTAITFPATYPSNPECYDKSLSGFYKVDGDTITDTAYDLTKLNQTTTPTLAGRWVKNARTVISSTLKDSDNFKSNAVSFSHGTQADYEANKASAVEVQTSDSLFKVYMWHDSDNNYFWYSPAKKVYLPDDCTDMFNLGTDVSGHHYYWSSNNTLKSLSIADLDWSQVTNTSNMFRFLGGLTSLDLGDVDTSHVTNMRNMFTRCGLDVIDVSKLNTSSVTNANSMFAGSKATEIKGLENFDMSHVTDMGGMFLDCQSLKHLDNIKDWDVSHVTNFGIGNDGTPAVDSGLFMGCSSLESLDVSGWDTSSKDPKKEALTFFYTTNIQKLKIGKKFTLAPIDYSDGDWTYYKTEEADGTKITHSRFIKHNLQDVYNSKDTSTTYAGTWVKSAPEPYQYKLAVQDADGNPVKAYTLSETDFYVAEPSDLDSDGNIDRYRIGLYTSKDTITTGAASIAFPDDRLMPDKHIINANRVDVTDKTAPITNTYTINVVPAMGSGLSAKAVTITVDYTKHDYEITSDATFTKGVTYDDATKTLTITLDKDVSDDSASDKGDYRYWSKQDVVEVGASDDFILKLNSPATTGLTYDANDTSGDMTYGILLDTVPGIASIPASEDDAAWATDKQVLSDWAKTWTVKVGDTTLSDDQKSAALQGYTPVLTVADNGTAVAGVKLDLTYLESIKLAGQQAEITMPHTVVSDKIKEGKYTTKVYIYSDTAYEAMYTATTAVNATKDPYEDDGDSLTGDGKGRIHIFNAVYGTNAPARDFTFKITPDSDDAPLPAGADIATDSNGKKYATVKIRGNGCYTGTMIFDKGGNYGYTITAVDDKADGWTTDATTYHVIYGVDDDWGDGELHVGSWIGDVSIDGTKLNGRTDDNPWGGWNNAAKQSYEDKVARVREKVFGQVSIVGTCITPNARGFAFEQSYQTAPIVHKPTLSKVRVARMAYVSTPSTDYDLAIFKKVTGTAIPDNYHFTATVTPDDATCPMPTNTDTWYDATNHTITFDNSDGGRARVLHFTTTTSGTYGYTVTETNDGKYGWDYDTHTYHVTYTIENGTATAVQTVDGTAITDSEKTDHAADYSDYTGSTPTSQDALVEITNHHFQIVVPSGIFDSKAWMAIAAGTVVIAAVCFVTKRKKR